MDWQLRQACYAGFRIVKHAILRNLPNRCMLCSQDIEQYDLQKPHSGVCQHCLVAGLYQHEVCLGCGKAMMLLQRYCGQCQSTEPIMVIAPCSYHQGLGELIAAIKYQQQCASLAALVQVLAIRVMDLVARDMIQLPQVLIPVPLHPNRLKSRGFNQAWLIAKALSQQLGIVMDDALLVRDVDTQAQAGLDGKARRLNCAGAFSLNLNASSSKTSSLNTLSSNTSSLNTAAKSVPYQRIALIDDVVTTGTTVNEISQLFAAEYVHVQCWCLARAEAPGLLK
jgi:predicted amidophosphoribosyltransferase